ncbi:polyketide cyclase [bacterium]|nr:polyketide cyclase [bacterium]
MSDVNLESAVAHNERVLAVSPAAVFAAFERPELLAQWWGPNGFRNTFEIFEFKPEGRWIFVMHGPNGVDYPNESIIREVVPHSRIVIEHLPNPWFRLTVTLTVEGEGTHLSWDQEFESPEMAAKMRPLCSTFNEQVLDRLQALVEG